MSAMKRLLATKGGWVPLVLRVGLAVAMFPHGAQKALGWFGGGGFTNTLNYFTGSMHIPTVFAVLAIAAEFLGPLMLVAGFATRLAALAIGTNMLVAIFMVHAQHGFFMNWSGTPGAGEGIEYHLLALTVVLALLLVGGGRASMDRALTKSDG